MAHFYASMQGSKGEATRCGTKGSGLKTVAASWEGAVYVNVWRNVDRNEDWASVALGAWNGSGASPSIVLYHGPISGVPEQIARRMEQ